MRSTLRAVIGAILLALTLSITIDFRDGKPFLGTASSLVRRANNRPTDRPIGPDAVGSIADRAERFVLRPSQDQTNSLQHIRRFLGFTASEQLVGKSYAIVIGIGAYHALTPLDYSTSDADKVASNLMQQHSFDAVVVLKDDDASKFMIEYFMEDYFPQHIAQEGGILRFVFYFTGHGVDRRSGDSGPRGYMQLADARPGFYSECLSMADILQWSGNLDGARHVLFLLDCCVSGLAGVESKFAYDVSADIASLLAFKGRHIMAAGQAEQEAIAGSAWNGSVFTDALVTMMDGSADANSDGVVTCYELYDRTRNAVANATGSRQVPHWRNLGSYKENGGIFFFAPRDTSAQYQSASSLPAEVSRRLSDRMEVPNADRFETFEEVMSAIGAEDPRWLEWANGLPHGRRDEVARSGPEGAAELANMYWYWNMLAPGELAHWAEGYLRDQSARPTPDAISLRRIARLAYLRPDLLRSLGEDDNAAVFRRFVVAVAQGVGVWDRKRMAQAVLSIAREFYSFARLSDETRARILGAAVYDASSLEKIYQNDTWFIARPDDPAYFYTNPLATEEQIPILRRLREAGDAARASGKSRWEMRLDQDIEDLDNEFYNDTHDEATYRGTRYLFYRLRMELGAEGFEKVEKEMALGVEELLLWSSSIDAETAQWRDAIWRPVYLRRYGSQ